MDWKMDWKMQWGAVEGALKGVENDTQDILTLGEMLCEIRVKQRRKGSGSECRCGRC
jgi:hypothetical protein